MSRLVALKSALRSAEPEAQEIRLPNLPLPCHVLRSRRKSLALHVRHDRIEVRAPLFVGQAEILNFLGRHERWLLRKLAEKQARHAEQLVLAPGATIFYQARELTLVFNEAATSAVQLHPAGRPTHLHLFGPGLGQDHPLRQSRAQAVLKRWLQARAQHYLPARTRALAEYLGVGDKLKDVVFRKTRSKWGHCTSAGRIQYNWLIMLAPDGVIDYMISHEVCHLLHMNHSAQYWRAVARVCPDYKRYVGWLKQHEHRLWF